MREKVHKERSERVKEIRTCEREMEISEKERPQKEKEMKIRERKE